MSEETKQVEVDEEAKKLKIAEEEMFKHLKPRLKSKSKSDLIRVIARESLHSRMLQSMVQQYYVENSILKKELGTEKVYEIFRKFEEESKQSNIEPKQPNVEDKE